MRDEAIESLRGFLIICVVLGHCTIHNFAQSLLGPAAKESFSCSLWYLTWANLMGFVNVYYFHMPLFLGISIFFVKKFSRSYSLSRANRILLPYVFWYLLNFFLYHSYELLYGLATGSLSQIKIYFFSLLATIRNVITGTALSLDSQLWFLPTLFSANMGYSIYRLYNNKFFKVWKYSVNTPYVIILLLWVLMFIKIKEITIMHAFSIIPFGVDIVLYLFPYFIFLEYVYNNRLMWSRINLFIYILTIVISISLISYFEPFKNITPKYVRIDFALLYVPFTMVGFIAMSTLSAGIMMVFLKIGKANWLMYIGRYALPIYLLHLDVDLKVSRRLFSFLINIYHENNTAVFITYLLSIVLAIVIPITISKLLMKISPLFRYVGMEE